MSEKIVEAVAKAIYEEMDLSDSLALPEATRYARAAIQAYEAALRKALQKSGVGCGDYGCGPDRIMDVIAEAKERKP